MGRIKGHYEWDDDDLTPGHKKEGGLHQNLFDSEGNPRAALGSSPTTEASPNLLSSLRRVLGRSPLDAT
jgi:hypothetical protein